MEVACVGANDLAETAQVKEGSAQSKRADLIAVRFRDAVDQATQAQAAQMVGHPARLRGVPGEDLPDDSRIHAHPPVLTVA